LNRRRRFDNNPVRVVQQRNPRLLPLNPFLVDPYLPSQPGNFDILFWLDILLYALKLQSQICQIPVIVTKLQFELLDLNHSLQIQGAIDQSPVGLKRLRLEFNRVNEGWWKWPALWFLVLWNWICRPQSGRLGVAARRGDRGGIFGRSENKGLIFQLIEKLLSGFKRILVRRELTLEMREQPLSSIGILLRDAKGSDKRL
jgi:hypothetical protein